MEGVLFDIKRRRTISTAAINEALRVNEMSVGISRMRDLMVRIFSLERKPMMIMETALIDSGIQHAARYTLEQVASILGRDLEHVRYLVTRRKVPAMKIGVQTWGMVRHNDLEAFPASVNAEVEHA